MSQDCPDSFPAVRIKSEDKKVVISAELADVEPEHLDVRVRNGHLVIAGHKKLPAGPGIDPGRNHLSLYAMFRREIALPYGVSSYKADAVLKNEILTITLPRTGGMRCGDCPISIRQAAN